MKSNTKATKIKTVVPSIVLEEMTIYGDIVSEGAVEIDGKVFGHLRCLSVAIGINAVVHGNITAEKIEINGEVLGDVTAKKIICGSQAKVRGNILHQTIHVENGAFIDGNCRKYVPELVASAAEAEVPAQKLQSDNRQAHQVAQQRFPQPEFEL